MVEISLSLYNILKRRTQMSMYSILYFISVISPFAFPKNRGDDGAPTFVKVYLEGVPVGRKLDLSAYNNYDCLIQTLSHMFGTTILFKFNISPHHALIFYLLTKITCFAILFYFVIIKQNVTLIS